MKLVLAEKPSVAMSLSKVIGADQRGDGYMEGNGYLVSWCVGHLVELSQPEAYDEKYAKWKYDDLPILPEHWQYQVSASTKKQFGILKKLMQRKDVESLICATDAGREGELIFRLVYHQCGCKKPVERLWISSMEDSAIREGFQKLRPGTEYDALYEAALCRERADWIVGINATRLFSCLYGQTLNVGRVMTPTLAMVVMRDAAIRGFKPEPFYSAELKFRDFQAGGERMKEKAETEDCVIVGRCADYLLRIKPDCRCVFITAPLEKRIRTISARTGLDAKAAKQLIKKVDKQRKYYYENYTDRKWGKHHGYDLCLDSSRLTKEQILKILTTLYETIE